MQSTGAVYIVNVVAAVAGHLFGLCCLLDNLPSCLATCVCAWFLRPFFVPLQCTLVKCLTPPSRESFQTTPPGGSDALADCSSNVPSQQQEQQQQEQQQQEQQEQELLLQRVQRQPSHAEPRTGVSFAGSCCGHSLAGVG